MNLFRHKQDKKATKAYNLTNWIYLISIAFIVLNSLLIYYDIFYLSLLPFALVIAIFSITSTDRIFKLIVFFTPISILISEFFPSISNNISIPAEPLMILLSVVFVLKIIIEKKVNKYLITHPVSISISFYLFWIVFTSISSSIPMVSVKFTLAKLWLIIPIYYFGVNYFSKLNKVNPFIWLYVASLSFVVIYSLFRHYEMSLFNRNAAGLVVSPFYNDHTAYGSVLALYLPVVFGFSFFFKTTAIKKTLIWATSLLFLCAILFSYSRAAWLSIVISLVLLLIITLKIKLRTIIFFASIAIIIVVLNIGKVFILLEKNKKNSSSDMVEHVQSIPNIMTDESNKERINRWTSVYYMFLEKPILGWGPGTFMFQYAPYQMSYNRTSISSNLAEGGNAHSEYLSLLVDSGAIGTLSYILIIITVFYTAIKVYNKAKKQVKILSISLLLGLSTYYFHGFLNNFLDTDKASVPFWGFTAIIVALDLYHSNNDKSNETIQ